MYKNSDKHKQKPHRNKLNNNNNKHHEFSTSLLDHIQNSPKKKHSCQTTKGGTFLEDIMKMKTPRMVEKKMSNEKVIARSRKPPMCSFSNPTSPTNKSLLDELDLQDTLFYSSTTTTTTTSTSKTEYSVFLNHRKPPRPKPLKIPKNNIIESKNDVFTKQGSENYYSEYENSYYYTKDEEEVYMKQQRSGFGSRGSKYSNLWNLRQPISPGARLTSFINSLFVKEKMKVKTSTSAPSTVDKMVTCQTGHTVVTRSCMSRNTSPSKKKCNEDGAAKRSVRFCPVGVLLDEYSRPCGHKSLFNDDDDNVGVRMESKNCEEDVRKFNDGLEKNNKQELKFEEVALDLMSGYWDTSNKSIYNYDDDDDDGGKGNVDHYGANYGRNYDNDNNNGDEDYGDKWSCSSSDLFELEHLSISTGDELPVYESTHFESNKIM